MATPRTLGRMPKLRFLPAFLRLPLVSPEDWPMVAYTSPRKRLSSPEGNFTRIQASSLPWMVALKPPLRTICPPLLGVISMLKIEVPTGILVKLPSGELRRFLGEVYATIG